MVQLELVLCKVILLAGPDSPQRAIGCLPTSEDFIVGSLPSLQHESGSILVLSSETDQIVSRIGKDLRDRLDCIRIWPFYADLGWTLLATANLD